MAHGNQPMERSGNGASQIDECSPARGTEPGLQTRSQFGFRAADAVKVRGHLPSDFLVSEGAKHEDSNEFSGSTDSGSHGGSERLQLSEAVCALGGRLLRYRNDFRQGAVLRRSENSGVGPDSEGGTASFRTDFRFRTGNCA